MSSKQFIDRSGVSVTVQKSDGTIIKTKALKNSKDSGEKFLMLYLNTDISQNDKVIFPDGSEILIQEVETSYWHGKPQCIYGYYGRKDIQNQNQVFNISTVSNSNIGNYNTLNIGFSISDLIGLINQKAEDTDKDLLLKMTSELETISGQSKSLEPGIFSRFSSVLQRNPWISGPLGQILVAFVTKQF